MIKTKKTQKKFYNKWLYKVTVEHQNSSVLRYKRYSDVAEDEEQDLGLRYFCRFLDTLDKEKHAIRIERRRIDLYTNDRNYFDTACKEFETAVVHCFAPDESKLDTLETYRTIAVNKLPYDRYKYKVFLHPHKIKDRDVKQQYIKWLESQDTKINISDSVKRWFLITHWNWDRRYMYVDDEKTLLMLRMKNPEAIGSVYTYEVCDK